MTYLAGSLGKTFTLAEPTRPLLDVRVEPGVSGALDAVAAAADPRHLFLRAGWFRTSPAQGLQTLIASRADDHAIAALPLAAQSLFLKAVPGSYWPIRSFPIAADVREAELAAFLADPAARRALGPVWRLGPVRADDPTASRLLPIASASGWTALTRTLGTAFVLDLAALRAEGPWPKTSTLRKNRHLERKLAEQGELEFRHHSGADWTPALFDILAQIERNSWIASKTDGSDAKFMAAKHRGSWQAAAADSAIAEQMHASLLFVGGAPAAFSFYLTAGTTVYFIANSYDERFRQQSPGRVLLYRDFQRLSEAGVERVDWGAGDPGYKSDMGAVPGPQILDHLFVRSAMVARLIRLLWRS